MGDHVTASAPRQVFEKIIPVQNCGTSASGIGNLSSMQFPQSSAATPFSAVSSSSMQLPPSSVAAPFSTVSSFGTGGVTWSNPLYQTFNYEPVVNAQRNPVHEQREYPPQSPQVHRLDAQTRHNLRSSLLQGLGDKFSGEAQHFVRWREQLSRRIREAEMDSLDTLNVLIANSEGRPKKLIQEYLASGMQHTDETLRVVWSSLKQRFGSGEKIAEALLLKLQKFPPIRHNDLSKLEDFYDMCKVICSHLGYSKELGILNLNQGLRGAYEKLPDQFQGRWRSKCFNHEEQTGNGPDFPLFVECLERYIKEVSQPLFSDKSSISSRSHRVLHIDSHNVNENIKKSVIYCSYHNSNSHSISDCVIFSKLPYTERKRYAIDNKMCFNCLGNHKMSECSMRDKISCRVCAGKHCSSMHRDRPFNSYAHRNNPTRRPNNDFKRQNGRDENIMVNNERADDARTSYCTQLCRESRNSRVCSKTIRAQVSSADGKQTVDCYVIIDEQSNTTFFDPRLIDLLDLNNICEEDYSLNTLSGSQIVRGSSVSGLRVKGYGGWCDWITLPAALSHPNLPDTRGEIATYEDVISHRHIAHLARHFAHRSSQPDLDVMLLIGTDCGPAMRTRVHGSVHPFVHSTALGWAVVGPICLDSQKRKLSCRALRCSAESENNFERTTVKKLFCRDRYSADKFSTFETRQDDESPGLSQEDQLFVDIISTGITTNNDGRLEMPLPIKPNLNMPNNRNAVYHRTKNTLDKLKRDDDKLQKCLKVFGEYVAAGHVSQINNEAPAISGKTNFIPIFPVNSKTKIRLVFDSSAVFYGMSLNKALLQGPDQLNKLLGVLLKFRIGEIGFTCDVEKMYHQFSVSPGDRDLLRFFWFSNNNPDLPIVAFRANVHIFGNKPSPAIANFGLRYTTLHPNAQKYPKSCEFILTNCYVDDALGSSDGVDEAISIVRGAREILNHYGIRLHKISSSNVEVTSAFPASELANSDNTFVTESVRLDTEDVVTTKTLGLIWNSVSDRLSLNPSIPQRPFTKRGVLVVINSVYDPFGLASPVTLTARLLQRKILPPQN